MLSILDYLFFRQPPQKNNFQRKNGKVSVTSLSRLAFLRCNKTHKSICHIWQLDNYCGTEVVYCIPFGTFLRKYIFAIHTINMFKFYSYPLGREGSGHNCKLQLFQFCDYLWLLISSCSFIF